MSERNVPVQLTPDEARFLIGTLELERQRFSDHDEPAERHGAVRCAAISEAVRIGLVDAEGPQ